MFARDGMVRRTGYPVVAPLVVYALTELGREYSEHLMPLAAWLETTFTSVERACETYDAHIEGKKRLSACQRTRTEARHPLVIASASSPESG